MSIFVTTDIFLVLKHVVHGWTTHFVDQMLQVDQRLDFWPKIFTTRTWYPSTILHRISTSQASVLLNLGIIDDLQQKSVEKGRKDVEKSLKRLRKLPEVADCEQERSWFRESWYGTWVNEADGTSKHPCLGSIFVFLEDFRILRVWFIFISAVQAFRGCWYLELAWQETTSGFVL